MPGDMYTNYRYFLPESIGYFLPKLNDIVTEATDSTDNRNGVPPNFVPLEDSWRLLSRHEPNALQSRVICSKSVHHAEIQGRSFRTSFQASGAPA